MKKLMAALLSLVMVCLLSACGEEQKDTDNEGGTTAPPIVMDGASDDTAKKPVASGESVGQVLYADFKEKMSDGTEYTAESLANALIGNEIIPFAGMAMAVEPGFLNGFAQDITGFAEAATFGPVIGSIPFVGYIFNLEDGADVDAFMQTLRDNANLNWNICVSADEMVCEHEGNTVFFVMCPAQFEDAE